LDELRLYVAVAETLAAAANLQTCSCSADMSAAVVMKHCCSLRAADAVARNNIMVPIELAPISPMIRCDQTHRAASSISNCTSDLFATGESDVAVKLREVTRDENTT
jgi:hypothetical protein